MRLILTSMLIMLLCIKCAPQQDNRAHIIPAIESSEFSKKLKQLQIPEQFALPEIVIGDHNAPNTVIVYSSFSCDHCKHFHQEELAKFKKLYVDTGKAKVFLRSYLDDSGSLEAALLMRSFGRTQKEIIHIYDTLYKNQDAWFDAQNPHEFLKSLFKQMGHSEEQINAALHNQKISAGLMRCLQQAMFEFGISAVPAFIVNGHKHEGMLSCDELWNLCTQHTK